jgi:hypothetical protein
MVATKLHPKGKTDDMAKVGCGEVEAERLRIKRVER